MGLEGAGIARSRWISEPSRGQCDNRLNISVVTATRAQNVLVQDRYNGPLDFVPTDPTADLTCQFVSILFQDSSFRREPPRDSHALRDFKEQSFVPDVHSVAARQQVAVCEYREACASVWINAENGESMQNADYTLSVFLNCPFDDDYAPLFEAAVFTIMDCGFHVRCAKERADASSVRIHKIYDLIRASRLGVHDLSRTELDQSTTLPRFNMPLELGIFLGAKVFGNEQQRSKECMVLDREKYRYQKYLSDVAGQDISTHDNDPKTLVTRIRDWLAGNTTGALPSPNLLWDRYQRFRSELPESCRNARQTPEQLTFAEYVRYVDEFRPSKDDSLIIGGDRTITNPSPADIRNALKSLPKKDPFAIYAKSGSGLTYLQTIATRAKCFELEYQAGSVDAHFACTNRTLSLKDVIQAFTLYAAGDERWRTGLSWRAMEL